MHGTVYSLLAPGQGHDEREGSGRRGVRDAVEAQRPTLSSTQPSACNREGGGPASAVSHSPPATPHMGNGGILHPACETQLPRHRSVQGEGQILAELQILLLPIHLSRPIGREVL